jgi:hypothetical protein
VVFDLLTAVERLPQWNAGIEKVVEPPGVLVLGFDVDAPDASEQAGRWKASRRWKRWTPRRQEPAYALVER